MKKLVSVIVCAAVAFCGFRGSAKTSYEPDGTTLKITVPAGETNEVDAAKIASLLEKPATVTDVRKLGLGCLVMNVDITAYAGDIHIVEGTWRVVNSKGLGTLSKTAKAEDVGQVFVGEGATLEEKCTESPVYFGKRIHIAGKGVNGVGALLANGTVNYGATPWGSNLFLDDDAFANSITEKFWYMNSSDPNYITFGGHVFTVCGGTGSSRFVVFGNVRNTDVGTIVLTNSTVLSFQGGNELLSKNGENGKIVVPYGCKLNGNGWRGRYEWAVEWDSTTFVTPGTFSSAATVAITNKNTLHGPVALKRNMGVTISNGGGFGLMGEISGSGGLVFINGGNNVVPTNHVWVTNPENTFSGGVVVKEVVLELPANGAVPADGGMIAVTNSSFVFSDAIYDLPAIDIVNNPTCSVENGKGKFKSITKRGLGTIDYVSAIGTDYLDLQNGYLRLAYRGKCLPWKAGLVEGASYTTNDASAASNRIRNGQPVDPVTIQLAPEAMYANHTYYLRKRPAWDVDQKTTHYSIAYTGYIWNREGHDVTWTFAGDVSTHLSLFLDGVKLLDVTSTAEAKKATVTLTPGPHSIYIGNYSKLNDGGVNSSAQNMVWINAGIRYDPQGRGSDHMDDYIELRDPGDGSLLTWGLPDVDEPNPVTGDDGLPVAPEFGVVKFTRQYDSAGFTGCFDLDGGDLAIGTADGYPRVVNGTNFTIRTQWKLDGADVVSGRKLTGIPLAFGDDAELVIGNYANTLKKYKDSTEIVIAESTIPVKGSLSIKDQTVAYRWSVEINDKQVILKRNQYGIMLLVR